MIRECILYKNSEIVQYTNNKAIIRLTAFVCLAKNLQNMEPNNAHTKDPEAPMTVNTNINPINVSVEWYTGNMYSDIVVMA